MSKKYLNLEEAAQKLGITVDQLKQYREDGEVRGFADRGSWKFREEDLEKLGRTLDTDSSPEVPMLGDDVAPSASIFDDEDFVGSQETVVRGGDEPLIGGVSDSDVRLVDAGGESGDDSGFDIPLLSDSDSDVRLVDDAAGADSDSDVKLVSEDSDSDVRLAPTSETEGELDLFGDDGYSDSDIRLIDDSEARGEPADATVVGGGDSGLPLVGDSATQAGSGLGLGAAGSGILESAPADSGISLELADSGPSLGAGDSGLTLELADSGISLEGPGGGSGMTLSAAESGLSLADDDDAMTLSADSGLSLEMDDSGSGGSDDIYQTIPMLDASGGEDGDTTHVEVPSMGSNESDFEIGALDEDVDGEDSNMLMFDDDEEDDDDARTVLHDVGDDDEHDLDGEFDDDLEVADDDLLGEDDELDVFDADDEDFDDGFEAGESQADFAAPRPMAMAPVEVDWGAGTFVGLLLSAGLMCLCCLVVFDLVQAMWAWKEPSAFTGALIESVGGLF